MRESRLSGLEGGARLIPRSYPYHRLIVIGCRIGVLEAACPHAAHASAAGT